MNGGMDFAEALDLRLSMLNLTVKMLDEFIFNRPVQITHGMDVLVQRLKLNGIHVCLVSGGIYPLVNRVANQLQILDENVFCNKLKFNSDGTYSSFDHLQLTSRSDGKAQVVAELMDSYQTSVIMVGDGITDAMACPPAKVFVGFGANANRSMVRKMTDYFCTSTQELVELFETKNVLKF